MKSIPVRQIVQDQTAIRSLEKFRIREVAALLDGQDLIQELHRHDFFFVLVLQSGAGIHEIDFTTYNIYDGSIFMLRPGQVHQLTLKAGSAGYLMEFNSEFYQPESKPSKQRLLKASNKAFCRPQRARFSRLHTIMSSIFQEHTDKQEGYRDAIKASLELLFIEMVRQSPAPGNISNERTNYAQSRLEEFQTLLEQHITDKKQASQYAQLMNLSLFQLNNVTKTTVGKAASELINEHIILEAKRYLLATPNQVKDIAYHLGYEDVSYFIRFFKKHTGYAPEMFRQNAAA
jgi:AraC-like DNA-binding protein